MSRYLASERAGVWSILDRLTHETMPTPETGVSRSSAIGLAALMNTLDDQQQWRAEAARCPQAVG